MQRRWLSRCTLWSTPIAVIALCAIALHAVAYDGKLHQQLTFLAAKQFNHCVAGTDIPMLTALQVPITTASIRLVPIGVAMARITATVTPPTTSTYSNAS